MSKKKTSNEGSKRTLFDDVFRTLLEKMPTLVIALINDSFETDYPEDVKIVQLKNEHVNGDFKITTDSLLFIEGHLYHIECQSNDDSTMVLRMFEYDVMVAIEQARDEGKPYRIKFPESAVLYLRHPANVSDMSEMEVEFPNGKIVKYQVKNVFADTYSIDQIFQKRLFILLPYYALRFEDKNRKERRTARDRGVLEDLISEFNEIGNRLDRIAEDHELEMEIYVELINKIKEIANFVFRDDNAANEEVQKMGGQLLTLYTEKLKDDARTEATLEMVRDGDITVERAAERLGKPVDKVERLFQQMFPNAIIPA